MLYKVFISFLILSFFLCNYSRAQKSTDTTRNGYDKRLTELEKTSVEKSTDTLGTLITTVDFHVKTDNLTDFKEGFIPWVELGHTEKDLEQLIGKDEVVVGATQIIVIIDYPLTHECRFQLTSPNGFTRAQLVKAISDKYHAIYKEEESSSDVKTVPADQRTTTYNRNQTNGKYGIWGHDLGDLALDNISVYKTANGDIVLSLDIDS
jgi:hypothetical protein